jgi:hypothetical protein
MKKYLVHVYDGHRDRFGDEIPAMTTAHELEDDADGHLKTIEFQAVRQYEMQFEKSPTRVEIEEMK